MANLLIEERLELVVTDSTLVNFMRQYNFIVADVYQGNQLVASRLKCYVPIEADELLPVFDERLNTWVLVDLDSNTGYVTTTLPHIGNQKIDNYLQ